MGAIMSFFQEKSQDSGGMCTDPFTQYLAQKLVEDMEAHRARMGGSAIMSEAEERDAARAWAIQNGDGWAYWECDWGGGEADKTDLEVAADMLGVANETLVEAIKYLFAPADAAAGEVSDAAVTLANELAENPNLSLPMAANIKAYAEAKNAPEAGIASSSSSSTATEEMRRQH